METVLIFHEGLHGSGVVIELRYDTARVIFDFGAPFRPNKDCYDGIVMKRNKNCLSDDILLGRAPAIHGIYKEDIAKYAGLEGFEHSTFTSAILISHMHLDHMSNISYVDERIPVYMSKEGAALHAALVDIGEEPQCLNIHGVELHEEIQIGEIHIVPYFSDHPCYGSVGYLIKTPTATIYYSGDIRFHGLQHERAFDELSRIAQNSIDLLILDGTSYSPTKFIRNESMFKTYNQANKEIMEGMFTEEDIYKNVEDILSHSKNSAFFCIYHRDMQLITALMQIASKIERKIVFLPETAYIINKLLHQQVYVHIPDRIDQSRYDDIRKENIEISLRDLQKSKESYFLEYDYFESLDLFNYDTKNGDFFHLFGAPFGTTSHAYKIMNQLLAMCELNYHGYANLYSFNHAFPNHLCYMIEKLNAKYVIPVHTNTPKKLNPMQSTPIFPEKGTKYVVSREGIHELG